MERRKRVLLNFSTGYDRDKPSLDIFWFRHATKAKESDNFPLCDVLADEDRVGVEKDQVKNRGLLSKKHLVGGLVRYGFDFMTISYLLCAQRIFGARSKLERSKVTDLKAGIRRELEVLRKGDGKP